MFRRRLLPAWVLSHLAQSFCEHRPPLNPWREDSILFEIVLSENIAFEVEFVDAPLTGQGIQGLIGRDILDQLVFTYNGPKNKFTVNYGG